MKVKPVESRGTVRNKCSSNPAIALENLTSDGVMRVSLRRRYGINDGVNKVLDLSENPLCIVGLVMRVTKRVNASAVSGVIKVDISNRA